MVMGMTIKYRLLQLVVLRHFIVHMIIGLWPSPWWRV